MIIGPGLKTSVAGHAPLLDFEDGVKPSEKISDRPLRRKWGDLATERNLMPSH